MRLQDYQRKVISQFKGLYLRGQQDEVPEDHSPDCANNRMHKRGETTTREGSTISYRLGHVIRRFFEATPSPGSALLTLDPAGNFYLGKAGASLSIPGCVDFTAVNIFGKTLIVPAVDFTQTNPLTNVVYIWDGIHPIRPAAGFAPQGSGMTVTATGTGNIPAGFHNFAVCYVTNTGFQTQPGPKISGVFTPVVVNFPGGTQATISNIPIGPSDVVQRIILVTRADERQYFFCPGGIVNDNTTTSITVNFFDTDLVVDASEFFNLLETIPGAVAPTNGSAGNVCSKYHGRFFVSDGNLDLVRVSLAGQAEAMDNVTGFIQIPTETDGNHVQAAFVQNDNIYFTKSVGILTVQDNLDVPSSWGPIAYVDGGTGAFHYGIADISVTQPSLSSNEINLLCDIGGLYLFNGFIHQPPLTWKVDDLWRTITDLSAVTMAQDPFQQIFYIVFPTTRLISGCKSSGFILLVGDYTEGLDANNLKWTVYFFDVSVLTIGMLNFQDDDSFFYTLRWGTPDDTNLHRLDPSLGQDDGVPINSYYKSYQFSPSESGGDLSVFRALRFSARGLAPLVLTIAGKDDSVPMTPQPLILSNSPGQDLTRQINFMNEKMTVKFAGPQWTVNKLEVFAKALYKARPIVA